LGGGLRTGAALGIELVISSLAGASLPPLVTFRSAKRPNTRIATTPMPSRVRPLGVSQGTAKRCRIIEHPSPRRRAFRLGGQREWQFYDAPPNTLLESKTVSCMRNPIADVPDCCPRAAGPRTRASVPPERNSAPCKKCILVIGIISPVQLHVPSNAARSISARSNLI